MKFNFDFIKNKKIYFIISAVLVSVSILSTFIFGVNLDIQFKGGTILTFLYDGEISLANATTDEVADMRWMTVAEIRRLYDTGELVHTLGYFFDDPELGGQA